MPSGGVQMPVLRIKQQLVTGCATIVSVDFPVSNFFNKTSESESFLNVPHRQVTQENRMKIINKE